MGLVLSTSFVLVFSLYLFEFVQKYCSSSDTIVMNWNYILYETTCTSNNFWSRYEKFKANVADKHYKCRGVRSREPSRISQKQLSYILNFLLFLKFLERAGSWDGLHEVLFQEIFQSRQIFIIIQVLLLLNVRVCMDIMFVPVAKGILSTQE